MTDSTTRTEDLFLILFCLADELYLEVVPNRVRFRNGADRMDMTDPAIITLSVMQEGRLNGGEFPSDRREGLPPLFPSLICRSRYHRRCKDLMSVLAEMLRALMNRLRLLAVWLMNDSAPAETPRWKSSSRWERRVSTPSGARQFDEQAQYGV